MTQRVPRTHTYGVIPGPYGQAPVPGRDTGELIASTAQQSIYFIVSHEHGPVEWC